MVEQATRNQRIIDMWNDGRDIDSIARAAHCTTHAAYEVVRRQRVKEPSSVRRRRSGFEIMAMRHRQRRNFIGRRLVELFTSGDVDPCQNLTTENVAALMGISTATVRKAVNQGNLRVRRKGRKFVFELGDVAEGAVSL